MKRKRVLVVVDMQDSFEASHNTKLIRNVSRLIVAARRMGIAIVVLEFAGHPPTHSVLKDLVAGYNKVTFQTKTADSGAVSIRKGLQSLKHQITQIDYILCGVHAECCVRATALGLLRLARRSARVRVRCVRLACNGYFRKFGDPESFEWAMKCVPKIPVWHLHRAKFVA